MEIQPSYRAMEESLPLPKNSVPVQGAVSVPGLGSPQKQLETTEESLAAGKIFLLSTVLFVMEKMGGAGICIYVY